MNARKAKQNLLVMAQTLVWNRPQTYMYISSIKRASKSLPGKCLSSNSLWNINSHRCKDKITSAKSGIRKSDILSNGHLSFTVHCCRKDRYASVLPKASAANAFSKLERNYSNKIVRCSHRPYSSSLFVIQALPQHRHYSSSLFVSGRGGASSAGVEFEDDLEERLKDVDLLKKNLEMRGMKMDVDKLVEDYKSYLELKAEKENWEKQREEIAQKIADIVKEQKQNKVKTNLEGVKIQLLSEEGKAKKLALKELMPRFWDIEEKVMLAALSLPNTLVATVPEVYEVLDEYFKDKKLTEIVDHYEVLKESKMVKLSNVGNKAYYLRGRLAELEQELMQHVCWQLRMKGVTQILAPEMFKTPVVEAAGLDVMDNSAVYRLMHKQEIKMLSGWDFDHLFLRGAGPLSFLSYFTKSIIKQEDLPLKMFVVGRNYMPENTQTKELPGLLGALQSTKVSMCGIADTPEQAKDLWGEFISILYSIYRIYELPYRMVSTPAWALSKTEQKRTEFQMWVPSQQQYLKIASVSDYGNYCSRRLNIRCSHSTKAADSKPVHMVHCEVLDVTRMIAVLLEFKQINKYWGKQVQKERS